MTIENFNFRNPTRLIFGKNQIKELGRNIGEHSKILFLYGEGSIKRNGVYEDVIEELSRFNFMEFGGIEPNPKYEILVKAVDLVKREKIDFLLAVGGGSVIDGTKFVALGALYEGDPWDVIALGVKLKRALPFGTVLTLPASGSEMNCKAVISKEKTKEKLYFSNPAVCAKFSILDPKYTLSLPGNQTSNGVADTFVHIMEQYLTYFVNSPIQDRFAEALLLTLMEEGPKALRDPQNYDVRENLMFASTVALNKLIFAGVPQDWTTHMIGTEITALFGIDHAITVAIILPSLIEVTKNNKREKLLRYAKNVLKLNYGREEEIIEAVIYKTRDFFESLGINTRLRGYGIEEEHIPAIIESLKRHHRLPIGERGNINEEEIREILVKSL